MSEQSSIFYTQFQNIIIECLPPDQKLLCLQKEQIFISILPQVEKKEPSI